MFLTNICLISDWMPSISSAMRTDRLPNRPSVPSDLTANLKNQSSKLLNRITCNFFDRPSNVQTRKSSQPLRHERRTIETNYISTISSLVVDKDNSLNNLNPITDGKSPDIYRRSPHTDAQCDNYGLYALKHNRNACRERRPPVKVPPPIPPPPVLRKIIARPNCDVVHEKFQSIESRLVAHPIVEQPRKKRTQEDIIGRQQRKGKAPLPKNTITRSVTIDAQRNIRSAMLLDTQLLEPPDESLGALTKNKSELYRIAIMHSQHSSLEDSTSPNIRIAKPTVKVEQAEIVKHNLMNQSRQHRQRNRLVKQLSTTDSINIFRAAKRQEDAFEDFNDELNFEPIVCVATPPERTSSFVSVGEPSATSPRTNYANRFAAAFAEAFSEEDGIADCSPTPTPTLPPPPLPQSAEPTPTASYHHRLSNPLVFTETSACDDHQTNAAPERISLPEVTDSLSTKPSPNLITNFAQFTIPDDDNNTMSTSRQEDAPNPTQLRLLGHPNEMRRLPSQHGLDNENHNNTTTPTKCRHPNSVTETNRPQQPKHHPHEMMIISKRSNESSSVGNIDSTTSNAMGDQQFYRSAQTTAVAINRKDGFEENGRGGDCCVDVLDVAASLSLSDKDIMSKPTTRRTVYVMNI